MGIVKDVTEAADWMAEALSSSGYRADFSPSSIRRVDKFFDHHAPDGVIRPDGLLGTEVGARLFGLGSYVGEVIRRELGGQWRGDDADPEAELNVALILSSGAAILPVQRIIKRAQNGPEDSIVTYCTVLGLDLDRTEPAKRGFFRR
jgi:hypothetical protein